MEFKKGDLPDMMIFLITITILAVGLFVLAFVVPEITEGLNIAGLNNSAEGANAIEELTKVGTQTIQNGFFLLFVGLIASVMISSFLVRTHPIFLFLYILFLGVTVFLGTYLGNMYETISETTIFAGTLASQNLINLVMENIVVIVIAVGALSMVIIFAKFSSFRGGSNKI
jgi:hypothetical protein